AWRGGGRAGPTSSRPPPMPWSGRPRWPPRAPTRRATPRCTTGTASSTRPWRRRSTASRSGTARSRSAAEFELVELLLGHVRRFLAQDDHPEDLVRRDVRLVDGVHDLAVVHDADAVREVVDVVDVVADQEDADALVLELADEVADLRGLGRPERGSRLVHDQDLRVEVDGTGDGHGLALPA